MQPDKAVIATPVNTFDPQSLAPLHPSLDEWRLQFNALLASLPPDKQQPTPDLARQALAGLTARYVPAGPDLYRVQDAVFRELPLRLYQPAAYPERILIFIHGGGHMAGSIEVYDPICRRLADATGCAVLSLDYPLAPENPWPAGIESVAELMVGLPEILRRIGLPEGIAVSMVGDSGGAAMAATLCLQQAPELPGYPDDLVLIYPSLDYRMQSPSVWQFAEGYFLTVERMQWYFEQYLQGKADPLAISPQLMPVPDGFPRTLVISAGYDPLRDEAAAFLHKLTVAGVEAEGVCYQQMLHAFLNLESLVPEACQHLYQLCAHFFDGKNGFAD